MTARTRRRGVTAVVKQCGEWWLGWIAEVRLFRSARARRVAPVDSLRDGLLDVILRTAGSRSTRRTARLDLTPVAMSDAASLRHVFCDADVRRYLLDGQAVSAEWVEAEILASARRFRAGSVGLWAVRRRDDPLLIGFVGFREFFDPPELQLLYGLLPTHWGRGFATEAAAAACGFAFETLGCAEIRAATDIPNAASGAVLRRLGFSLARTTDAGEHGTAFYVLTRHRCEGRPLARY